MLEERQVVGRESLDRGQSLGQIQPTVCFVNEVLLEHSQAHLFMYHLWLLFHYHAKLDGGNRDGIGYKG